MSGSRDRLAIIGIGCRFPGGVTDPSSFWRLLVSGADAITDIPPERAGLSAWYDPRPATPGRMMSRRGGFLDHVDRFDAAFFEMSPREASRVDPQQRLLLETSWEALEDAGIDARALAGSRTGVFVGEWGSDYEAAAFARPAELDFFGVQGSGRYTASGRLSFAFGFRGPALTVDTACSSSLVATHLACRSLQDGDCEQAVVAGVNLLLQPHVTIAYSQSRMMAPDGRCKFGDASGDGYVRSEGVGVVVLKPLARALTDGDRIYAVIRGSATNNDGRSSGLLGRPGRPGQEEVVRAAYRDAGVAPGCAVYVEAHGTGTRAGDPVEVGALATVLAEERAPGSTCLVGSVKTNIGHTEAAAGVAGLIKAALVLRHGTVPASLHCDVPNPAIDWADLVLAREATPLPPRETARIVGVNSFGISGTNAHVVLEEAPALVPLAARDGGALVLPLSARTPEALAELAGAYAERLAGPDAAADVCATTALHRTHLEERAVFVGSTRDELVDRLGRFAKGDASAALAANRVAEPRARRLAFVFPGQGGQWIGMARELLAREPAFRATLERADAALSPMVDWSLLAQLRADPADAVFRLDDISVLQPVLVAVEVALAEVWRAYGVEPAAVVGHSLGEAAAACVSGALTLEDALSIACRRSRLMRRTSGQGAMVMVELAAEEAEARAAGYGDRLAVAVHNGPRSTVVSGEPEAVRELAAALEADGVFARLVKVDVASHGPQMDPLVPELVASLDGLVAGPAIVPLYSTVTGAREAGESLDAAYWGRNLRQRVRFREAVAAMQADGIDGFIEMSPHPVLLAALAPALALPSTRREEPEQATLRGSLGALFVAGHPVDWRRLYPSGYARVDLPHYPWQRERFWWEPTLDGGAAQVPDGHPFLGHALRRADGRGTYWEATITPGAFAWLVDHRVGEAAIFPAAAFCEVAVAAARAERPGGVPILLDVQFIAPLVLGEAGVRLQVSLQWTSEDRARFAVHGASAGSDAERTWTLHASGDVSMTAVRGAAPEFPAVPDVATTMDADDLRVAFTSASLAYGAAFRPLRALRVGDRAAVGQVRVDPASMDASAARYFAYPPLLDAALQSLVALLTQCAAVDGETVVPASIGRLRLAAAVPLEGALEVRVALHEVGERSARGGFRLLSSDGSLLAEAEDVVLARIRPVAAAPLEELLYDVAWRPVELGQGTAPTRALLLAPEAVTATPLATALIDDGAEVTTVVVGDDGDVGRAVRAFCAGGDASPGSSVIVHLLALATPCADEGDTWLERSWRLAGDSILELAKAVADSAEDNLPRVWLVTSRAVATAPGADVAPSGALLWGLGRVLAREVPTLSATLLDLERPDPAALASALRSAVPEGELALRDGQWLAPRLQRRAPARPPGHVGSDRFASATSHPGLVERLHWRAADVLALGPDDVELEVCAVGLNFMNVLSALGTCPGYEQGLGSLGIECAGRVARVGSSVRGIAFGDAVVAIGTECLASHAVVHRALVAPLPAGLSWEDAAGIPIAFLTAWYALHHLARLGPGERVLVHSAAGGVGLAAIQVARHLGAEVVGTAGTEEKRSFLRSLGVTAVFDSRGPGFADQVLAVTGGRGVDVVLNSLAGDAIEAGLRALAPYGRFVELGKRDIYGSTAIGLQPFRRNLAYFAVDLDRMMRERPEALGIHLRDVMARIASGDFVPVPTRIFAADTLVEAFQGLLPGTHKGKHVVSLASPPAVVEASAGRRFAVSAGGTYLITGGLGALGLETAGWLARRGAGCVVLLARNAPSEVAKAGLAGLERYRTRIEVMACDVTRRADLERALAHVRAECPPLRGVFHAAGVLEDAPLAAQSPASLRAVGAPKVLGAWHLDRLTAADPLDAFVLFSSVAALFGTPGQGNYAAANAFLDALAHVRRARGAPALSVDFGPVRDVGLAAADAQRGRSMARLGFDGMVAARVTEALDALLAEAEATQVVCTHLAPHRWRATLGGGPGVGLLAELLDATPVATEAEVPFAAQLRDAPAGSPRRAFLESALREEVGAVLRMAPARVPVDRPLRELGLDSLMALELRHRLEQRTALRLSPSLAWNFPTVRALGEHVAGRLSIPLDAPRRAETSATETDVDALLAELGRLSDEDARRLLAEGGRG